MNTPLGTEVVLGPDHVMLDGDLARPPRETGTAALSFRPMHVYCGHGRPSQLLLSSCINLPVGPYIECYSNFANIHEQ